MAGGELDKNDHELLVRIDERLNALRAHIDGEFASRDKALDAFTARAARSQALTLALVAGALTLVGVIVAVVAVVTH